MSETFKTDDYDKFTFHPCNAVVKPSHVAIIQAAMERKSLFHVKPMLVNEKMEIIDGQHRFKAAKNLGHPIYYQIEKDLDMDDMSLLNSGSRVWGPTEFIHHYSQRGLENYSRLKRFSEKYDVAPHLAAQILGITHGKVSRLIKTGKLSPISIEAVEKGEELMNNVNETIEFIVSLQFTRFAFMSSVSLKKAVIAMFKLEGFNREVFHRKVEMQFIKVIKCTDTFAYLSRLLEIYNWNNAAQIQA